MKLFRSVGVILGVVGLTVPAWLVLAEPRSSGPWRYAVLVGVQEYDHSKLSPLQYAENDAVETARVLANAGYAVTLLTGTAGRRDAERQPTLENIRKQLARVLGRCKRDDTVVVGLAGHGLQFEKIEDSFFCPRDARPFLENRDTLLSLKEVYDQLDRSGAGVKLLLVDACRDDPRRGRGRGIDGDNAPRPPRGVGALFSCSAGEIAFESDKVKHGVFFHYVLEGLRGEAQDRRGRVTWDSLRAYVKDQVSEQVPTMIGEGAKQHPNEMGNLSGQSPVLLVLNEGKKPVPGEVIEEKEITNSIGMKLVRIPAGKFLMGSPKDEEGRFGNEGPQHEVRISRTFYLGKYEVTRGQFRTFVAAEDYESEAEKDGWGGGGYDKATEKLNSPTYDYEKQTFTGEKTKYNWRDTGFAQTDEHPVVNVSWNDAKRFCGWLSRKEGKVYRLPTEAEWEYACRAGTTTRYSSGDDAETLAEIGNVADGTVKRKFSTLTTIKAENGDGYVFAAPAPVGQLRPNRFGLYDMHGNACEWCEDRYGNYRGEKETDPTGPSEGPHSVFRGGGWDFTARYCRSAYRLWSTPIYRNFTLGFRMVLVPSVK